MSVKKQIIGPLFLLILWPYLQRSSSLLLTFNFLWNNESIKLLIVSGLPTLFLFILGPAHYSAAFPREQLSIKQCDCSDIFFFRFSVDAVLRFCFQSPFWRSLFMPTILLIDYSSYFSINQLINNTSMKWGKNDGKLPSDVAWFLQTVWPTKTLRV